MHKVFNADKHKYTYHVPNYDYLSITWDTDGYRKVWCKNRYCHESLIIGTVRVLRGGAHNDK